MSAKIFPDTPSTKDFLYLNLRELPYFRALLRAVEGRFYQEIDLPQPVLDVGSGDGQFAAVTFDQILDVGIDPWWEPTREAFRRGRYKILLQSEGSHIPYPNSYFGSAFSNSVLEHIPDLEPVLAEVNRVLQPGAPFAFCVPNHQFLASLSIGRFLDRLGLHRLANAYRSFFNRIARHHHCDPPEVWQKRLEQAGFQVERWWHYYPPAAMQVTEWGHYFGLPSWVSRQLTGRWILSPSHWNLFFTERLLRKHYEQDPICADGVCTFYIAKKNKAG